MIYLDNAATTFPKPKQVYENTYQFMRESAGNPGRGAHYFSDSSARVMEETRRRVARFFGVPDPHRVVFTYNCTDSINIVLKGLLRSGDHVIASNLDHNSVSRPLESLARNHGIEVTRVRFDAAGLLDPGEVRSCIQDRTELIVITHGSNVLGSIQLLEPFRVLAEETGIPVLLDAAQTAGRIPIDVGNSPIFVVCSAHKNLYGMPGIGILTVPPGVDLRKWREGGSGTVSENLHHPDELPMALEAGTPNFLAAASLKEGIAYVESEGMSAIHEKEQRLAAQLKIVLERDERFIVYSKWSAGVSPANGSYGDHLGVVAFNIRNVPTEEAAAILDHSFGIAVRGGLHCAAVLHSQMGTSPGGCLRASPGYFNTESEIETALSALKQIAENY